MLYVQTAGFVSLARHSMISPLRRSIVSILASSPHAAVVRTGLISCDRDVLGAEIHAEMVGLLYSTLWPLAIISVSYFSLSLIAYRDMSNLVVAAVGGLGTITSVALFCLALAHRFLARETQRNAAAWERRYAIGIYLFSACLGCLAAMLFLGSHRETALLGVALLYGYGSGVVARLCMRPRIAILSLLLATLPTIAGMIANPSFDRLSLAGFSLLFLVSSFETVLHIYKSIVAILTMQHENAALARKDELTGLPNRRETRERLAKEITRVARHGGLVAVLYLDLDHFKSANDCFGHPIGDLLLKDVATRLLRLVRAGDVVGRVGGDEFLVVQTGIAHISEAEVLAMRIVRSLGQPFNIQGREIVIGVSIGIAFAPTDSSDMAMLIKYADMALYSAKARAQSSYAFHKEKKATAPAEVLQNADALSARGSA